MTKGTFEHKSFVVRQNYLRIPPVPLPEPEPEPIPPPMPMPFPDAQKGPEQPPELPVDPPESEPIENV